MLPSDTPVGTNVLVKADHWCYTPDHQSKTTSLPTLLTCGKSDSAKIWVVDTTHKNQVRCERVHLIDAEDFTYIMLM